MLNQLLQGFPLACCLVAIASVGPIRGMDLETLLELAGSDSPQARVWDAAVKAERGRARGAGRRSNPRLSFERQAITSADPEQDQNLLTWTQPFDLRHRRSAEKLLAGRRVHVQEQRRDEDRFRLRIQVRQQFIRALFRREEVRVRQRFVDRLAPILDVIEKRVEAGDAAEYDRDRLSLESSRAQSELESARLEARRELGRLAALAGVGSDTLESITGNTDLPDPIPDPEELIGRGLAHDPRLEVLRARSTEWAAEGELARRLARPEVELDVAYQRTRLPSQEDGYGFKVSVLLPLFDKLEGRQEGARLEAERLGLEEAARSARMEVLAASLIGIYQAERERLHAARTVYLDQPQRLAVAVESAYREGHRTLIEILDAHRVTRESRLEWLRRLEALHLLRVDAMESIGLEGLAEGPREDRAGPAPPAPVVPIVSIPMPTARKTR